MAAFLNPDSTFAEQAERVLTLYQRICDVRDDRGHGEGDARHVCLNNITMAAGASVSTLRLLHWAKQGGDGVLIQALGLSDPSYIHLVAEDLLRASRLHLLVEYQFQVETLFRDILLALGKDPGNVGFYKLVKELLREIEIGDPDDKRGLLNVPALMRNSMHANGIHHGYKGLNTEEVIDGVEFRFEHGKRVQCGSWYHIDVALTASINVVDEILGTSSVVDLGCIPDEYAVQRSAEETRTQRVGEPDDL